MISQSKFETASVHTVRLRQLLVILALMMSCAPTGSKAQFIRFAEAPQDWHGSLQTSVSRYRSASGVELDLVAAVHVADKRYYDKLNAYFADRDLVLYELVTDGSSTDSARGMSESGLLVVGWLQVTAASLYIVLLHQAYQEDLNSCVANIMQPFEEWCTQRATECVHFNYWLKNCYQPQMNMEEHKKEIYQTTNTTNAVADQIYQMAKNKSFSVDNN